MESPFLELPDVQSERLSFSGRDEFISKSPFGYLSPETGIEHQTPVTVDWKEKARMNGVYAQRLGWLKDIDLISDALRQYSGIMNKDHTSEAFAKNVVLWQLANGFKLTDADGVIGPNTYKAIITRSVSKPTAPSVRSKWHDVIPDAKLSQVLPLVDGQETFDAMAKEMSVTQPGDYIYIMGWMIDTNFVMSSQVNLKNDAGAAIPCTLANLLIQAARRNVGIRVLIWSNPGYTTEINVAHSLINKLPGGRMLIDKATFGSDAVHNAQKALKLVLDQTIQRIPFPFDKALESTSKWKKINAYASLTNEGSHHEKVIIIKRGSQLTGFCGGIDLNPNRIPGKPDDEGRSRVPHDVHCMLHDHGAWELLKRFHMRWESCREFNRVNRISTDASFDLQPLPPEPAAVSPGTGVSYVKVMHTYNKWDKTTKERTIKNTIKKAIEKAERHVYIEDQYMVSCEIAGWLNAKLRTNKDFKVDIHTQDDEFAKEDMQIPKRKRDEFLRKLKEGALNPANISIGIYTPRTPLPAHHQMHSKLYVIDTSLMIIGSANCNRRSMQLDSETAAFIFDDEASSDPKLVSAFLANFNKKDADSWIIDYKPNAGVKDLDEEIADYAKVAFLGALIATPIAYYYLTRLTSDLSSKVLTKFWEVIDPNPDQIECAVPALTHELPQDEWLEIPVETTINSEEWLPSAQEDEVAVTSFLSPDKNLAATRSNQTQIQRSGLSVGEILTALAKHVDVNGIRTQMSTWNASSSKPYAIESTGTVGAVFTEAVHQFQIANYLDPKDQDGVAGVSTFDTLGFINHGLHRQPASGGYYGQAQLNRSDVKDLVSPATNAEFNHSNWFNGIVYPAWLGVKVSGGLHLLLYRKLKEAENWLYSQPQYRGLSPAALGKALGFDGSTRYSAARLSADKQAMHGFGLAVDINVAGNPWIGAGWIKNSPEATQMIRVLKNASGNQNLPGQSVLPYLHNIAVSQGNDTRAAYNTLKQRSDEFVHYLSGHPTELAYWKKSYTFGGRNPLKGFLNLHADLVYALRQIAGLAWGAIDFGPGACGDIMHFDLRTVGVGKILCQKIGGYVPKSGHPSIQSEIDQEVIYEMVDDHHEAVEEAWSEVNDESVFHEEMDETMSGYETDPVYHEAMEEGEAQWESSMVDEVYDEVPDASRLGRLVIDTSTRALAASRPQYQFTSEDALWLARFVEGEAGGRNNAENHAVIWAMFNRFGMSRHAVPAWTSFSVFLRLYSTTLQPLLNSLGAAKRVWQNHNANPSKYPVVFSEQKYSGTDVKKVQYSRHIQLQKKPWKAFSADLRDMVVRILTGQIPNPGIGPATHFASTMVYLKTSRRNRKISGEPTYEEWKQYTLQFARQQKWIWIGERSNLNQIGNAFFIQPKFKDVPATGVRIELSAATTANEIQWEALYEAPVMGDEYMYEEIS